MSCTLALKSAGTDCKIEKKARFKVLFSSRLGAKIEASFLCTRLSSPVHPFVITARGGGNFCSLSGPSGSVLLRVLRLFIAPIFPRSAPISLIVSFLPSIPFRRNVFYFPGRFSKIIFSASVRGYTYLHFGQQQAGSPLHFSPSIPSIVFALAK